MNCFSSSKLLQLYLKYLSVEMRKIPEYIKFQLNFILSLNRDELLQHDLVSKTCFVINSMAVSHRPVSTEHRIVFL